MLRRSMFSLLLLATSSAFGAEEADSLSDAFSQGKAHLNFRYRYEQVDQDDIDKDAGASTLRTRLNLETASYRGFSLFLEADDVSYPGNERFNNARNGQTNYPAVADPNGTDINQAYINLAAEGANFRLGRQRINRDNQRFVGGVGWRQNEQTYDAFEVSGTTLAKTRLHYAYIDSVSRIFGPDSGTPDKTLDSNTHLLNVLYEDKTLGGFSFYAYAMDFDNAAALSNRTLGVRYQKTLRLTSATMPLTIELSQQDDHGHNPTSYSANYYLVELGYRLEKVSFGFGFESLEGSDSPGESFQTPLATLHKFQGWADKFLTTPTGGMEDTYLSTGYQYGKSTFTAVFHQFDAETGSANYGSEWDVSWHYRFNHHYSLLTKAARFEADDFGSDTTKLWLMFTASF